MKPTALSGFLIFCVLLIAGCSQKGSEYIGTWKDSNVTVTISKDGDSYLIKADNPTGMLNGTFKGKIQNGELVLNQTMFGNISYSQSENALLFAGATLKRAK